MKTRIFASFNGVMQNDIQCMFHYKFNQNVKPATTLKRIQNHENQVKMEETSCRSFVFMYGLVRSILLRNFERGFIELII